MRAARGPAVPFGDLGPGVFLRDLAEQAVEPPVVGGGPVRACHRLVHRGLEAHGHADDAEAQRPQHRHGHVLRARAATDAGDGPDDVLGRRDGAHQLPERGDERLTDLVVIGVDEVALGDGDHERGEHLGPVLHRAQHVAAQPAGLPRGPRLGHQGVPVDEHDDAVALLQVRVELGHVLAVGRATAGGTAAVVPPGEGQHLPPGVVEREIVAGAAVGGRRVAT